MSHNTQYIDAQQRRRLDNTHSYTQTHTIYKTRILQKNKITDDGKKNAVFLNQIKTKCVYFTSISESILFYGTVPFFSFASLEVRFVDDEFRFR